MTEGRVGGGELAAPTEISPDTPLITIEFRLNWRLRLALVCAAVLGSAVSFGMWRAAFDTSVRLLEAFRVLFYWMGLAFVPFLLGLAAVVLLARRTPVVVTPAGVYESRLYVAVPPRRRLHPFARMADIRLAPTGAELYVEIEMEGGEAIRLWVPDPTGMAEILRKLRTMDQEAALSPPPQT